MLQNAENLIMSSTGSAITELTDKVIDHAILIANPDLVEKVAALKLDEKTAVIDFDGADPWALSRAAAALPSGYYEPKDLSISARQVASWALAQYRFKAHRGSQVATDEARVLVIRDDALRAEALAIANSVWFVRDLVNQPANLLGPEQLAEVSKVLATAHGATLNVFEGDAVVVDFPALKAVGQAAARGREPRIIDMSWGSKGPRITLVGKGVCYDTGGLNLKPGAFMRNMKKDMGGAAHVLALAHLVMTMALPIRLRVLVGAVENAVGADSFRPGDVIGTRAGKTVEIGNTDAEGRLVLADCLTLAQEGSDHPDLLIDFATLTGAARVALGTALPAVFSNHQALADELVRHSQSVDDPLWSLPLPRPYAKRLKSVVADLGNIAEGERYGDAIMAALFLDAFVEEKTPWLHLDCFAWNVESLPGRPKGGEAQGLLAVLAMIQSRLIVAV